MAVDYSTDFRKTTNSTSAAEFPFLLLEISHADLGTPIRVINDRQDLTSNGDVYTALGFRATLPDQRESGLPKAALSIDNVGKELVSWLESSNGGSGATVHMMQVMRSAPNVIEWEVTMNLTNVAISPTEVTGTLSFDDILNNPALKMIYDPDHAPGLY